jgi:hypothetical protein
MTSNRNEQSVAKVFLSHAHADNAVAREVYLKLRNNGFSVFIDDLELHTQDDLRIELERHLNESVWFLLLWSGNSNREWVLWELKQALSRAISRGVRIVVAALDRSDRPDEIKNHLYIDLTPSLRVGIAELTAHLTDQQLKIVNVPPGDELYRADVTDLKWYLKSAQQSVTAAPWRLAVGDSGLFTVLGKIYDLPPQVSPKLMDEPLEEIRHAYLDEAERLFCLGEILATRLIKEMGQSQHIEILPLEACRRYLSWLMAYGFSKAWKYLTHSEYDALDHSLKTKFESLQSMQRRLDDSGLARNYATGDPIDLLFGTEVPLNPEIFVWADLIFKSSHAAKAGSGHVVLRIQKSRAPVYNWAERLMDSEWPPEPRLLDERAWALLFLPQIARELTHNLWTKQSLADPESLGFAFHKESYVRLGPS